MAFSVFDISKLDKSEGFVIKGIDNYDNSGRSVSSAGDVNGDGIDDLIIGAPYADADNNNYSYSGEGQSYVVFGRSDGFAANLDLASLNGNNGFTITGINNYDKLGSSVSSAGDINGDGIDDLIIGAPNAEADKYSYSNEGQSYVVFGRSDGFAANLDLASLNGNNGFIISGIDKYDNFGSSVSSAGDINGDGIDDLIVGAPYADANNYSYSGEGQSYVVFGKSDGFAANLDLASLDGNNGFTVTGINNYDNFGSSVSSAGDINGDGIDDLIIGAPNAKVDNYSYSSEGQSYVVFGRNDGFAANLDLASLDGNNGFTVTGINNYDKLGSSVSSAGDINGDGIDDLIIGAPNADGDSNSYSSEGQSYVVFGRNDGFAANLDLASLNGNNGFTITGIDKYDNFGSSVSSAGDINGDGIDDLIIGAPNADAGSNNYSSEGEVYVIFGRNDGFAANLDLANAADINGLIVTGVDSNDKLGFSVSNGGDINGDDIDDLIVGAPSAANYGGESYVIFGVRPSELIGTNKDDILTAGKGNDLVSGFDGNDIISGFDGDDNLLGGNGNDLIIGGDGNDVIRGQQGDDNLLGGDGNDSIEGGSESDKILGELGNDSLFGNSGSDRIIGGSGDDFINAGMGNDSVLGEDGNDLILGAGGNDTLEGNAGDDLIEGKSGKDEIFGGDGSDTLFGGDGNDVLIGGANSDSLDGGNKNDIIIGVEIDDPNSSFGTGELDTLTGGRGNDIFVLGNSDRVFYDSGNSFTVGDKDFALITDFQFDEDTIQLRGSADFYILDLFSSSVGTTDARLIFDAGDSATTETIAVIEDVDSSLIINDSIFTFV